MTCLRTGLSRLAVFGVMTVGLGSPASALADDPVTIEMTLKNHRFTPSEIRVPAGRRADLHIRNEDSTAEEFESSALKVEKIVPPGAAAVVHLRPLAKGRFPFVGEFHPDTAQGVVISE